MRELLYFLIGYKVFYFDAADVPVVLELLFASSHHAKLKDGKMSVRVGKIRKMRELLGTRVKFRESELLGIGGCIYRSRRSYGALFALILSVFLLVFSSGIVWDVRIEGDEVDSEAVIAELAECGLYSGRLWSTLDRSSVEVKMLGASENVSWININRRGGVAYVSVIKKEVHEEPPEKQGYSNVVAACDAVIEEITVSSGIAAVSVGDSVRKGDILISGVIPSESGGGFCYAEGRVVGRVSDSLSVTVSSKEEEKLESGEKNAEVSVNIFNFPIKIFKIYGNLPENCDIIEEKKEICLEGGIRLPFSVTLLRAVFYTTRLRELNEAEMTERAGELTAELMEERLGDATLVRLSTSGEFKNGNYVMETGFVYTDNIGVDLPFTVSEK